MSNIKLGSTELSRRSLLKTGLGAAVAATVANLGAGKAFAAGGLLALVHTQAAGDNGPVDSMIEKLKQIASENNLESRAIYASDPATYETIFRTLGDAGAAIIVSTFNEVAEPFKTLAPQYPNTKWIQLFADPFEPTLPNVVTVAYDYYLGCYLSGMFGALISKTGKLGYVGGVSVPPLNADANAVKAGALSVRPDATVAIAFAGSFQDPAKGQQIASEMYKSGIDFVQVDSGGTDAGVIAAANENPGSMVSGLASSQYKLGPKSVINLVELNFGQSLYNEVTKALKPDWKGAHEATKIGDGVVDIILSPTFAEQGDPGLVAKAKEVWPQIEAARAKIIDGSLKVPFQTSL